MQRNRARWALGFGLAVIVGAAGWVISTTISGNTDEGDKVASIVAAIATLVSLALTLFFTRSRARSGLDEASSPLDLIARQLADSVKALSMREEEHRRIGDPRPLSVQWRTASEDLFDRWENIHGTARAGRCEPMSLAGGFTSIRETYEAVPSGRLVILGRAGAGKTVLAHRLILALLDDEDRPGPVPVLFSLSAWAPKALGLRDWLVGQLVRDFPFLDVRDHAGKSGAQVLVESGRVLPVLDGFDEIPDRHHRDAIDEISRIHGPLIVTSRPDEYANAAQAARALSSAAAIKLADLTLAETRRYLQASTNKTRTAGWDAVFDHLRTAPDEAASQNLTPVLTTPLMVMLARTTYNDTQEHDPRELLDTTRFPTRADLEEHLLAATLNTLYDPRRTTGQRGDAPGTWTPERARHWLGYLATHLTKRNTHDVTWWQLPNALSRPTRILITTTTLTLTLALTLVLTAGLPLGLAFGLAIGLPLGLINEMGFSRGRTGREPEQLQLRLRRRGNTHRSWFILFKRVASEFAVGLTVGVAFGLATGVATGLTYGFAFGLAVGVVVGLAVGLATGLVNVVVSVLGDNHDPRDAITPWQLLTTDRTVTLVRTIAAALTVGLVFGHADGRANGLVVGLAYGFAVGMVRLALSAWGRWLVFARLWLPLTGRLPWRPKRFLEDAYRRGVLRQAGAVYQFRHARLRDHLARHYRTTPGRTPPTIPTPEPATAQESRHL